MDSSLSRVIPGGGTNPLLEFIEEALLETGEGRGAARRAAYWGSNLGREGEGRDNRMLLRFPVKLVLLPNDCVLEAEEVVRGVFICCGELEVKKGARGAVAIVDASDPSELHMVEGVDRVAGAGFLNC